MTRSVGRDFSFVSVNVRTRNQSEKAGLAQYGQDFCFLKLVIFLKAPWSYLLLERPWERWAAKTESVETQRRASSFVLTGAESKSEYSQQYFI